MVINMYSQDDDPGFSLEDELTNDPPPGWEQDTDDPGPDAGAPPYEHRDPGPEPKPNRFKWVRDIPDQKPQWRITNLIEENALAMLFGDPGCGKSFMGIDWACCVAAGVDYCGMPVKQTAVVFLIGEGFQGFRRRVKAWCGWHGIDIATLPLCVSSWPGELTNFKDVDAIVKDIHGLIGGEKPGLIVVDTVARNFGPGNENDTRDMGIFISACDRLRCEFSAAVLCIHHSGHSDKSRSRGSMALRGALDTEYRMERGEDGIYRLFCTKMKEFAQPLPMAFSPKTIDLGTFDDCGEPVTSMIFENVNYITPENKTSKGMGAKQALMREVLAALVSERDQVLTDSGKSPEGCCPEKDWIAACRDAGCSRQVISTNKKSFFIKNGMVYQKIVY